MSENQYSAGVRDYRETYWEPDYTPKETDLLACFKIVAQAGVSREEAAAAVVAESSTGIWTTVWTDLIIDLTKYNNTPYALAHVTTNWDANLEDIKPERTDSNYWYL